MNRVYVCNALTLNFYLNQMVYNVAQVSLLVFVMLKTISKWFLTIGEHFHVHVLKQLWCDVGHFYFVVVVGLLFSGQPAQVTHIGFQKTDWSDES